MNLSISTLKALRGRHDLKEDDNSLDAEFLKMEPIEIVRECTAWHLGDPSWANLIARLIVETEANPKDMFI